MSEQFGWSEWIEFKAGVPCPIAWAQADQYEVKWDAEDSLSVLPTSWEAVRFWRSAEDPFHYRYSLPAAPAGFVPPGAEKPWYPPQQPGFGPWIEANSYPDGISGKTVLGLLTGERRERRLYSVTPYVYERDDWAGFVAYCLKLEDQPTQEQVEATQQPWSLEQDAADWAADSDLQNRPMFDADDVGVSAGKWDRFNARLAAPTAAPGFMVRDVRSSDGLLTVREADHRLGGW